VSIWLPVVLFSGLVLSQRQLVLQLQSHINRMHNEWLLFIIPHTNAYTITFSFLFSRLWLLFSGLVLSQRQLVLQLQSHVKRMHNEWLLFHISVAITNTNAITHVPNWLW